jgi:hypothetical protein
MRQEATAPKASKAESRVTRQPLRWKELAAIRLMMAWNISRYFNLASMGFSGVARSGFLGQIRENLPVGALVHEFAPFLVGHVFGLPGIAAVVIDEDPFGLRHFVFSHVPASAFVPRQVVITLHAFTAMTPPPSP